LIYASLGTIHSQQLEVFARIAEACAHLDAQLVIALAGGGIPETLPTLPGDPLVLGFAPQLALLQRAALNITHAGLNTVLESLRCGVLMVAIPIANDQPGVAARVAWSGCGAAALRHRSGVGRPHLPAERPAAAAVHRQIRWRSPLHRHRGAGDQHRPAGAVAGLARAVVSPTSDVTTPMSAKRFADRFRFYKGQPQQQRGVRELHAAISSSDNGAEILDEQVSWAVTFSEQPPQASAPAGGLDPRGSEEAAWPARTWQHRSNQATATCW
jgi:hypothetical protein